MKPGKLLFKQEKEIEDLQEAIINAGGKFFRKDELLQMTFGEMLESFIPNSIQFNFKHVRLEENENDPEENENDLKDDESLHDWHEELDV